MLFQNPASAAWSTQTRSSSRLNPSDPGGSDKRSQRIDGTSRGQRRCGPVPAQNSVRCPNTRSNRSCRPRRSVMWLLWCLKTPSGAAYQIEKRRSQAGGKCRVGEPTGLRIMTDGFPVRQSKGNFRPETPTRRTSVHDHRTFNTSVMIRSPAGPPGPLLPDTETGPDGVWGRHSISVR